MPVTLVDRLPLPNLKVYTAGSVLMLSVAVYYAMNVTSDPTWQVNATLQRQEAVAALAESTGVDAPKLVQPFIAPVNVPANVTRNLNEQFFDVLAFMMQEPLCMWTVINSCYCAVAVAGVGVQRAAFGRLRVAEAQRLKDKFWNYVFYKFIFVFGVINVQYMDEVLLWASWFTLLGFLQLLTQLARDRFEYVSMSAGGGGSGRMRVAGVACGVACAAGALLRAAHAHSPPHTFAFMAAECVVVLVSALQVCARCALDACAADTAGPLAYYTHLVFDSVCLVAEAAQVLHQVAWSRAALSLASLVLLMQLRHVLHELRARLRRHSLYAATHRHMTNKALKYRMLVWTGAPRAARLIATYVYLSTGADGQ